VTLLGNLRRRVRKCPYRYGDEPTEGLKPPHPNTRSARRGRRNEEPARKSMLVASLDAPRVRVGLGEHFAVLEASLDGRTARRIAAANGGGDGKAWERKTVRAQDNALAVDCDGEKARRLAMKPWSSLI